MPKKKTILRARISSHDRSLLRSVIKTHHLDVAGGFRRDESGEEGTEAYATEETLQRVRQQHVHVQVIEDATAIGGARQAEVGKGDRFAGGEVPQGLGQPVEGDHVSEH